MTVNRRARLADVAQLAQVDVSLVSRVLRGQDVKVRDETKSRILEAADELNYRPNALARSLQSQRAGAFGLVIPNFTNPVYAQIIEGAEEASAKHGAILLTSSGAEWNRRLWVDAFDGGRIDGLLVAGRASAELDHVQVPTLWVNQRREGVRRHVVLDDAKAVRMAVEHLIELGHEAIAFVGGPAGVDTSHRRLSGFRAAMSAAGLAERAVFLAGDYTPDGGRIAVAQPKGAPRNYTAVVAANLAMALGVQQGFRAQGVPIPDEVSMVAIHDSELADAVTPRLTTVRMPLRELGRRALDLLATSRHDASIQQTVAEPMELVVRDSTAPPQSAR